MRNVYLLALLGHGERHIGRKHKREGKECRRREENKGTQGRENGSKNYSNAKKNKKGRKGKMNEDKTNK
jgi:hypothetical protein